MFKAIARHLIAGAIEREFQNSHLSPSDVSGECSAHIMDVILQRMLMWEVM
jgi:hypothetical protein